MDLFRSRIILYMDEKLSRFEQVISKLISSYFIGTECKLTAYNLISRQLRLEISSCARLDRQGQIYAPDQYTLSLNPLDFEDLQHKAPHAQSMLSKALHKASLEAQIVIAHDPNITLATDPTLARNDIRVIAWHSREPLQFTKEFEEEKIKDINQPPEGAFFIIEGKRYFPLVENIIKIGRRLDNHLILEDRHVSRSHAQLEVVEGRYVITDLNSTAGTRINGRLITRHTLKPGDIVSIAAVQMIYGEDPSGPPEEATYYQPPPKRGTGVNDVTPLNLKGKLDKSTSPYKKDMK